MVIILTMSIRQPNNAQNFIINIVDYQILPDS